MDIEQLRARQAEIHERSGEILATAAAEKREITDAEQDELANLNAEFRNLTRKISTIEAVQEQGAHLSNGPGRQTEPEPGPRQPEDAAGERIPTPHPAAPTNAAPSPANGHPAGRQSPRVPAEPRRPGSYLDNQARAGFPHIGEFARSVYNAVRNPAAMDQRLSHILNAPTTYGQEGTGADGGFAVPPAFRSDIVQKVMGEDSLWGRVDQQTTSSNSYTVPTDETTPWGTSGIRAYWTAEGAQKTQSKPALGETTVKLFKLAALVPVTDELLEDAPSLDRFLRTKAGQVLEFEMSRVLLSGTGVGQPLGVLNSPATIAVAKDSGQTADTITYSNIRNMWSAMRAANRQRAVWVGSQSIETQLLSMTVGAGANQAPAYLPGGTIAGQPFDTIFGRPVLYSEAAEQLGDLGDLTLLDLSQYLGVTKVGGMKTDVSIHLWFDYDVTAFRFVLRVGGQPWWAAATAARDGSFSYSPFVALAERA